MTAMTVIIFLIVLAVLIFVHELGHFLLARACGIRVDSFKIGFGPKIFAWTPKKKDGTPGLPAGRQGETEYGVNWIPFGGYVKIFGENPDEDSLDRHSAHASDSFALKTRWQQAIVLAAGVFFNFLFAWLLYTIVFTSGVAVSTDSFPQYASRFQNQRVMITDVIPGSPADKAGLKAGDAIGCLTITGRQGGDKCEIDSPEDVQSFIADIVKGQSVEIDYGNGRGPAKSVNVIPVTGLVPGKYAIGIAMDKAADLKLPIWSAAWAGLEYTGELIKETVVGLYTFIVNIFVGHPDFSQVAGPIGIAGIIGNAAELGFTYLLMITAIISINLGVINLIPFPALDGGRILFVAIEGLIRRRISAKFTNAVNAVGFALLMALMVVVTYKDIAKLIK
jgi:regulator of sigma E protease